MQQIACELINLIQTNQIAHADFDDNFLKNPGNIAYHSTSPKFNKFCVFEQYSQSYGQSDESKRVVIS